jgi:catechol 2,3-dioxygenase-like lactoylglutathione lyase family enzyme
MMRVPGWARTLATRVHATYPRSAQEISMAIPLPAAYHHTCFLVRDLEGTAQRLSDSLGVGPWNIWTIQPARCMVRGQEIPFSFRVALATVGGGSMELVAPHSGRSVIDEQLEQHGSGFHHSCFVYDSLEAVGAAKAELRRQGREIVQEASAGDVFDFAYVQFPEIGALVEVLYLDASKLPPPEAVIHPRA